MTHEFLKYGAIGLSFILAFLAFKLLSKEQEKKNPNKTILFSIYSFMIFSLLLSFSGFSLDFFKENNNAKIQIQTIQSNTDLTELKSKIKHAEKSLNDMLDAKSGLLFQLRLIKVNDEKNQELFDTIVKNIKDIDKILKNTLKD